MIPPLMNKNCISYLEIMISFGALAAAQHHMTLDLLTINKEAYVC